MMCSDIVLPWTSKVFTPDDSNNSTSTFEFWSRSESLYDAVTLIEDRFAK